MAKRMDEIVKYLKASPYRRVVLNSMGTSIISPEKIRTATNLQVRTIVHVLKSLETKGIVKSMGKTGKRDLYVVTALGKAALQIKNQWGLYKWKGTSKQKTVSRRVSR